MINSRHIADAAAVVAGHTATAGLDGLVNNAGIGVASPVELLPLDTFRRPLEVDVTGQLAVAQAAARPTSRPAPSAPAGHRVRLCGQATRTGKRVRRPSCHWVVTRLPVADEILVHRRGSE